MIRQDSTPRLRSSLLRDAGVMVAAVVLTFMALDDITTDTDTSFVVERIAVILCAGCLFGIAWRVWQYGYHVLGGLSTLVALAIAFSEPAVAAADAGGSSVAYLISFFGLVWFTAVAIFLVALALRSRPATC